MKLTHTIYAPAGSAPTLAVINVESQAIRYRVDGAAPTATVGHPVIAGDAITVCGPAVGNLSMIRRDAVDATASASYYR